MTTKTQPLDGLTEAEQARRGKIIAQALHLKHDREHPDRYQTDWGTKTDLGLFRMIERIILDGE